MSETHPLHEEVVQNLQRIMTQLQNTPPQTAIGGEYWWRRYEAIEDLCALAKEYALLTIPEDIETLLRSIREQRKALIPVAMSEELTRRLAARRSPKLSDSDDGKD